MEKIMAKDTVIAIMVGLSVLSIFTAWLGGSLTIKGQQKLIFPASYHYEAIYGDIFVINFVSYFVLKVLPALPDIYHTGIFSLCMVGSWFMHRDWAPLPGEEPLSHFFKKTNYARIKYWYSSKKGGWWKSLSMAGWFHLFFLPIALTIFIEWAVFVRDIPAQTALFIGFCYFVYCLIAVMGYHTSLDRTPLQLGYNKIFELAARFAAVLVATTAVMYL